MRARLRQAFGRLIRSAADRGHFVLLGAATPSRLLDAFPGGVPVLRVTLDEAVARIGGPKGRAQAVSGDVLSGLAQP